MEFKQQSFTLNGTGLAERLAFIIGGISIALSAVAFWVDPGQFYFSWLVAFVFWTSIALGGLFFTLIHHLTGATWSVVVRRFFEVLMTNMPFLLLMAIPVFLGMHELYHWSHADAVSHDHLLQHKAAFLNVPFFIIRTLIYFAVWIVLTTLLYRISLKQDDGASSLIIKKLNKVSAPGVILFAFTTAFAAFDWLMSLDPHWYSTIFGVYYFAGSVMAVMAVLILIVMYFRKNGILTDVITPEHDHDFGKLLFTYMVFWAYMAFSQYFLIWYANIPEETVWFIHRWEGSWKLASQLLVLGHFVVPFLILMIRASKRSNLILSFMAIWLLFMHWLDMYWLAVPTLHPHGMQLSWIDLATMLGIGGLYMGLFFYRLRKHAILPIGDPKLNDSIHMVNQ